MNSQSRTPGRLLKAPEHFLDPAGVRQVFAEGKRGRRDFIRSSFAAASAVLGAAAAATAGTVPVAAAAEVRTNASAGAPASLDAVTKANKNITRIVYILQLASLAAGLTFIAAVILNYVKRKDVEGTWLESHFRWQIHTFWYCLLWMCVGLATLVILVGFFVLIANVIWMLFRAIKGISNLEENKPMPE